MTRFVRRNMFVLWVVMVTGATLILAIIEAVSR